MRHFLVCFITIFLPLAAVGDEPPGFAERVRPILEKHCLKCHGPTKQEGGLRLDSRNLAFRSGDNYAPVIKPGNSSDSPLFQFISREDADLQMPPEGNRLTRAEIETVREWIDGGAEWPEETAAVVDPWSRHWSFRPIHRPPLPDASGLVQNAIDRFINARLAAVGLSPSVPAPRQVLIRRLFLDLVGLPPTPEEVASFENDPDPLAYEKLVDRLLASPRFGERWARHWLDVVRFAESHGFEMNQPRPNAWPYRDYVIRSLNEDKPYDQFLREQLAGDYFGADEATGFLVGGPWDQVKSPDPVLTAQQRADELHDIVSTTGSAFLGLTIGCARCHSHKFDPVSQTEYYAFKACFESVQHGERPVQGAEPADRMARRTEAERLRSELADLEAQPVPAAVNARLNVEHFETVSAKKLRFTVRATSGMEPCIDELEVWTPGPDARNVALAIHGAMASASSVLPNSEIHRLEHIHDGQYGNGRSWISNEKGKGWVEIKFVKVEQINRVLWGRDREQKYTDRLATDYVIEISDGGPWRAIASAQDHAEPPARIARRKELQDQIRQLLTGAVVYAGRFTQPGPTFRLHRGDPMQPREPVTPGSLTYFGYGFQLPRDASEQDRRLALANWITDPRNPLTARVVVNRLWQYHFGTGIVSTPSDFGVNGGSPSHPELLDWLASEWMHPREPSVNAWSMKHIHRLICTSAAYRQSSSMMQTEPSAIEAPDAHKIASSGQPQRIDAAGRTLWRFPPRRLEAEIIRDSILSVSGTLDLRMGGPGFDLFEANSNYVKVYVPKRRFGPDEFRRMIYQSKPRMQLEDTFGAFDCPDAGQIAPKRNSSTTPLQALNLLNSPFVVQQSEFFARRLQSEAGEEVEDQVERGFQLAFGRSPTAEQSAAAVVLVRQHGLPSFCRALFNANEFLFIR